jgi:hypothetical protein
VETYESFADPLKAMYEDIRAGKMNHPPKDYIPKVGNNQAWLIGMALVTAILGTIISKYWSGKWPWQWIPEDRKTAHSAPGAELLESVHPRTGKINPKTHKPERFTLPTGLRDFEHASEDPKGYVRSSMSGTLGNTIDTVTNRNFFGDYVYDPNGSAYQKMAEIFAYNMPKPIGYQQLTSTQGNQSTASKVSRALGFTASSGAGLDLTPAERIMRDIYRAKHDPKTPAEQKSYGDRSSALPTKQQMTREAKYGEESYAVGMFNGLTYGEARKVMDAATPAERRILQPLMDKKRQNALQKNKVKSYIR